MLSQHKNDFIACWAYVENIKSLAEHKQNWFHSLVSQWRIFSEKRVVNCMMVNSSHLRRWRLIYRARDSSTARGRLIYRRGDSSMEEKISLWRGRLFYGGEDSFLLMVEQKTVESCLLIYIFSPVKSCLFMWYFGIKMLQVVRWWSIAYLNHRSMDQRINRHYAQLWDRGHWMRDKVQRRERC
jgi:hypothetical protein